MKFFVLTFWRLQTSRILPFLSSLKRYATGLFTKDYKKTIGVDFLEKERVHPFDNEILGCISKIETIKQQVTWKHINMFWFNEKLTLFGKPDT